jgi:hydroxymethylpyrimidine kinase/phosphomethylpyrimidine kinase
MAAITALTVQNTQGFSGVHFIPPAFVGDQIAAVFADIRVDAVKVGMIANAGIARAVVDALKHHCDVPVVLDPVMIAKGGASLLAADAIATLRDTLLPLSTILTPNLPEAAHLLGVPAATIRAEMVKQGRAICALGPKAVLMKGGHLDGEDSPDVLVMKAGEQWFNAPRTVTLTVDALVNHEMALHVKTCAAAGIDEATLFAAKEEVANLAYTRYVMDAGLQGDFLDLVVALAPCCFGYGEISHRLAQTSTSGAPYADWIATYAGSKYQQAMTSVGLMLDAAVSRRLGSDFQNTPRWAQLQTRFITATELEVGFWNMGLRC